MLNLYEHIEELKYRILYILLGFIGYFFLFYVYSSELFYIIAKPLLNLVNLEQFIYTNLIDVFFVYFKLALWFSFFLSIINVIYHLIAFLMPGLYLYELNFLLKFGIFCYIFFYFLLLIFYFFFIPIIWSFFLNNVHSFFEIIPLVFEARITEYFALIFKFLYLYIFLIQIPIFILFYIYYNFLSYNIYKRYRFLFFGFCSIYIMVFGPPDFGTQLIILIYSVLCIEFLIACEHILAGYYLIKKE